MMVIIVNSGNDLHHGPLIQVLPSTVPRVVAATELRAQCDVGVMDCPCNDTTMTFGSCAKYGDRTPDGATE